MPHLNNISIIEICAIKYNKKRLGLRQDLTFFYPLTRIQLKLNPRPNHVFFISFLQLPNIQQIAPDHQDLELY
jgi:hypothetical protein